MRNALGSLAVLATLVVMAFGLPFVDRSMPAARAVGMAVPYKVGGKVTVVPPAGSSVDLTRTRPGDDRGTAMFLVEGVRLSFLMGPYHGTLADAAARLHSKITNTTGVQVPGADRQVMTSQGVAAYVAPTARPGDWANTPSSSPMARTWK